MRIIYFIIAISALVFFSSCANDKQREFSEIQGYYHYKIIDFTTGAVKDSLFACVRISKMDNYDALRIENSILGLLLAKDNKFSVYWHVEKVDGNYVWETYTFLDRSFKPKATWSVEQEIGFESGPFERKFAILSSDTSLGIFSRKLDGLLLLEQRDWQDVGGTWSVQLFGFDPYNRLVFVHKYIESKPWGELTMRTHRRLYPEKTVIHDSTHTYYGMADYLVLHEFIEDQSISDPERERWENKNSSYSKQWLYWKTEIEDFAPPPMPITDPDSTYDDYEEIQY